jgi:hypothetical protein
VLRQPRNELPVRQQKSKNSQGEVNALHPINSFAPLARRAFARRD